MVRVEGGTGDVDSNYESLRSSLHRSPPIAAVIRPDDLLQVGLEGVEQAQHGVGGVPAGVAGGSDIVVDPAGEWPDAVDRAGPAGEVEEGAEPPLSFLFGGRSRSSFSQAKTASPKNVDKSS